MDARFKLSIQDVLEKQFHIDFKGYSSVEVDEFLDDVIKDYQQYETLVAELGAHLQNYEKEVATLKAKVIELEGKNSVNTESVQISNVDLLKRISKLEAEVFKNK